MIRFGGPALQEPVFTHFDSAITGGMLHGHVGEVAYVVTQEEADALKKELLYPLGPAASWTAEERTAYAKFAGAKLMLESDVRKILQRFGERMTPLPPLGELVDAPDDIDIRVLCGLPPAPKAAKGKAKE
jgi:hypothetical protein